MDETGQNVHFRGSPLFQATYNYICIHILSKSIWPMTTAVVGSTRTVISSRSRLSECLLLGRERINRTTTRGAQYRKQKSISFVQILTEQLNKACRWKYLHIFHGLCQLASSLRVRFDWRTFMFHSLTPEGRPGMSDVSPLSGISGLSFDSTLLSPLSFFCLVLLPFLSYRFLPAGPFF